MKWMKWGLGAAAALLAGGALTFAVLAIGGTASAQEGPGANGSRFVELLAQKLGISVDQLKTASTDARNQLVDELLAAGTITQAQADKMKSADIGAGFGFHIGGRGGPGAFGVRGVKLAVDVAQITADLSKISIDVVKQELQQGKSFAQIAAEHGSSRDALKSAVIAAHTKALQERVASGQITQAQADKMAAELSEHVDQLIDHTGGFAGPRGMKGGMRPGVVPTPSSTQ
jgi:hypothetical protein